MIDVPVSILSKGGWAERKCSLDTTIPKWFDSRFPPLAVYYGGCDTLIDTEALVDRLKTQEPDVKVIRTVRFDQAEHCDFYYGEIAEQHPNILARSDPYASFSFPSKLLTLWSGSSLRSWVSYAWHMIDFGYLI